MIKKNYLNNILFVVLYMLLPISSVYGNNSSYDDATWEKINMPPPWDEIFYVVDTIHIENPKVIWWEGNAVVVDSVDIPKYIPDFKEYLDTTNFYLYVDLDDLLCVNLPKTKFKELFYKTNEYNLIDVKLIEENSNGGYEICNICNEKGMKINNFLLTLANLRWLNYCQVYTVMDGKEKPFEADYELNMYVKIICAIKINEDDINSQN